MQREAAIREPLILGHKTYKDITDDVVAVSYTHLTLPTILLV